MSVVNFPQEEKVWECNCGCQVFYIVSFGGNYVECAECDNTVPIMMTPLDCEEAANE